MKEGLAALWASPGSEQATGLRGPATAGTEEQKTRAAIGQQERGGRKGQTLPRQVATGDSVETQVAAKEGWEAARWPVL